MNKIIIDPHNCSREEYAELKEYLSENCWDFKEVKEVDTKSEKIAYIKKVIGAFGAISTGELEESISPCISCIGEVSQLVEGFNLGYVDVVTYVGSMETNEQSIPYEDLKESVIDEIVLLIENYEADQLQTEKRIS